MDRTHLNGLIQMEHYEEHYEDADALQIDKTHNLMTTNSKTEDATFSIRGKRDGPVDIRSQKV